MNKSAHLGLSVLELSNILMYEFWYDYVKPNIMKKQSCVIWIQIIIKMLQKMLKLDLILQIMNQNEIPLIDHYQKEKIKN